MHQPRSAPALVGRDVRAHQITLACLRAPGELQSAENPPAGQRAVSSTRD